MQLGPFGLPEILVILALALIIFGPKRLPQMGRALGKALEEFRRGATDLRRSLEKEVDGLDKSIKGLDDPARGKGAEAASDAPDFYPPKDTTLPAPEEIEGDAGSDDKGGVG
jgi:sec-independent protein translocase protein TatA